MGTINKESGRPRPLATCEQRIQTYTTHDRKMWTGAPTLLMTALSYRCTRQLNPKTRSLPHFTLHADLSTIGFDNRLGNG